MEKFIGLGLGDFEFWIIDFELVGVIFGHMRGTDVGLGCRLLQTYSLRGQRQASCLGALPQVVLWKAFSLLFEMRILIGSKWWVKSITRQAISLATIVGHNEHISIFSRMNGSECCA